MCTRIFIYIFMVVHTVLYAQITINSGDLLSLTGQEHSYEVADSGGVVVNVGYAGENQTWDFTSIVTSGSFSQKYTNSSDSPYSEEFSESNFLIVNDFSTGDTVINIYNHMKVTPDLLTTEGIIIEFLAPEEEPLILEETDNDSLPLPLTYGASWSSKEIEISDLGEGSIFLSEYITQNSVDAWGTVILPSGSYQALRVRRDITDKFTYLLNDQVLFADSSTSIAYQWMSKEALILVNVESMEDESDPNFSIAQDFWRLKSMTTSISAKNADFIAADFQLYQNYPNPFNPTTNISFDLARAGMVELTVYDSNGRHIATLLNGYQNAGRYTLQWDASGLASGVYYYQLKGAGFKLVKKGILMK